MSNDAWYQRAMARAREAIPTQRPPQQQPTTSTTWNGNVAWTGNANQNVTFYPQPQPQAQPQAPGTGQKLAQASTSQLLQMQSATGQATPGIGAQLNPNNCPNCGQALFYERLEKVRRGPPPAPHCFTCGYNGLFEQGLESSWSG